MKKILLLLVFLQICFASVNIISPRQGSVFYLGDQINLIGNIQSKKDCEGTAYFYLDNNVMKSSTYSFKTGSVIDFDSVFGKTKFTAEKGSHLLKVSCCTGEALVQFSVTDELDINYAVNDVRFMLGDELKVKAYAVKHSVIENITEIEINGKKFTDSASYSFSEAGNYSVRISAQDGFGNSKELLLPVQVSEKLNLEIRGLKSVYMPSENLSILVDVFDAFNRKREANITVSLNGISKEGKSSDLIKLAIPLNMRPGKHFLITEARQGKNYGRIESEIIIEEFSEIGLETLSENGMLFVNITNIGNKKLENITLKICDSEKCFEKNFSLNASEKKQLAFNVSGEEASISVNYENKSLEKTIPLTGAFLKLDDYWKSVIFLSIIAFCWFVLSRKRLKKKK